MSSYEYAELLVSFALDPPATWLGVPGAASPSSMPTAGAQTPDDQLAFAEALVREMGGRDVRSRS